MRVYWVVCQAGAIAAGNTVCVKVSETLPATSSLLVELFPKYLDPNLYRVVNGDIPVSTKVSVPALAPPSHSHIWTCIAVGATLGSQ